MHESQAISERMSSGSFTVQGITFRPIPLSLFQFRLPQIAIVGRPNPAAQVLDGMGRA